MPCVSSDEVWSIPVTSFDPKAQYTEQLIEQARADIDDFKKYAAHSDTLLRGCINKLKDLPKEGTTK